MGKGKNVFKDLSKVQHCIICGLKIMVMCQRGTGVCSENCAKTLRLHLEAEAMK